MLVYEVWDNIRLKTDGYIFEMSTHTMLKTEYNQKYKIEKLEFKIKKINWTFLHWNFSSCIHCHQVRFGKTSAAAKLALEEAIFEIL